MSVAVVVNGKPLRLAVGATVADLVAAMGATGKRVAVERNGEIVPRSAYVSTFVVPGDKFEIVMAVGGG